MRTGYTFLIVLINWLLILNNKQFGHINALFIDFDTYKVYDLGGIQNEQDYVINDIKNNPLLYFNFGKSTIYKWDN